MTWFLIINDSECKKEFQQFVKKNADSVLYKGKAQKSLKNVELALNGLEIKSQNNFIVINSSSSLHVVKVNDIVHCQSNHSYTELFLADGRKLTASKTLKQIEESLNQRQFIRIHQSHLVNVNYMVKYAKGDGGHIVLTDKTELPVATRKKEHLIRELEKL